MISEDIAFTIEHQGARTTGNEKLFLHLRRYADPEGIRKLCNVMITKDGYNNMIELGKDMKKDLDLLTSMYVCTYVHDMLSCTCICVHTYVYTYISLYAYIKPVLLCVLYIMLFKIMQLHSLYCIPFSLFSVLQIQNPLIFLLKCRLSHLQSLPLISSRPHPPIRY